jgi:hypothetical protein
MLTTRADGEAATKEDAHLVNSSMQEADSRATGSSVRIVSSAAIVDVRDFMRLAGLAAELTI